MKKTYGDIYKALAFLTFLLMYGCASPQYNYKPSSENISEPPINSINTVAIGDNMVKQGNLLKSKAIHLSEEVSVGVIGSYYFSSGHYLFKGQDETMEYYNSSNQPGSGVVTKSAISDPFKIIGLKKENGDICGISFLNAYMCTSTPAINKTEVIIKSNNTFQQTLIYNGKIGNKINVGYREFSSNYARPAFNNDVEYDLNESNIIGYKGALLEVLEATNQTIKFKLLKNFK